MGNPPSSAQDENWMNIFLEISSDFISLNSYRAYAEVYATSSSGEQVPVSWIASIVDQTLVNGQNGFQMTFNLQWLSLANAKAPLTLKNIVIQDITTYIIVATAAEIPVTMKGELKEVEGPQGGLITEEMIKGKRPANLTAPGGKTGIVLLVHGYCSGGNPWSCCMGDWTNADYVDFGKESISNDAFARKIANEASKKGISSYSVVGFSQGGMAVAHLYNYYWAGVDVPKNPRVVQTLVTPFRGTSIAGSSASLGKVFGVGCGVNNDLTRDGSSLWGSGIPTATRNQIYSYAVQYGDNGLNTRYCNNVVNMFLEKPNDGTCEVDFAFLSASNVLGVKVGWCHTSGMKYPAAATDSSRNKQMNSLAARS